MADTALGGVAAAVAAAVTHQSIECILHIFCQHESYNIVNYRCPHHAHVVASYTTKGADHPHKLICDWPSMSSHACCCTADSRGDADGIQTCELVADCCRRQYISGLFTPCRVVLFQPVQLPHGLPLLPRSCCGSSGLFLLPFLWVSLSQLLSSILSLRSAVAVGLLILRLVCIVSICAHGALTIRPTCDAVMLQRMTPVLCPL